MAPRHIQLGAKASEYLLKSATRIPGLVHEHRTDKANDDIGNSARTKGSGLKTSRIPRTLSALLLVELSIHGFYWIFPCTSESGMPRLLLLLLLLLHYDYPGDERSGDFKDGGIMLRWGFYGFTRKRIRCCARGYHSVRTDLNFSYETSYIIIIIIYSICERPNLPPISAVQTGNSPSQTPSRTPYKVANSTKKSH